MNWGSVLLWGFVATVFLTGIMAAMHGMGWTRMSVPYMLGSMFTPDRDRARLYGTAFHFANGLLFALLYAAAFESWGRAEWWAGMAIGLVHAGFVLTAGMSFMPGMHPRMASEQRGPTPTRQMEPPGFLALNYGRQTPLTVTAAHLVYGGIIGMFYQLT